MENKLEMLHELFTTAATEVLESKDNSFKKEQSQHAMIWLQSKIKEEESK